MVEIKYETVRVKFPDGWHDVVPAFWSADDYHLFGREPRGPHGMLQPVFEITGYEVVEAIDGFYAVSKPLS